MQNASSLARPVAALGLTAALLAACGDDPGGADASPDSRPDFDAVVVADAPLAGCDADQICFDYNAIDGVTDLPAGRLVVLWIPPESGGADDPAQVGYDGAWTTAVTALDLGAIAAPDAAHQTAFAPCGTAGHFGIALAVIGTDVDTDDDGQITVEEFGAASIYGIFEAGIVYSDVACAATPDNPSGILTGVHVYDDDNALADGVPTELQTCSPGTAACEDLEDPL